MTKNIVGLILALNDMNLNLKLENFEIVPMTILLSFLELTSILEKTDAKDKTDANIFAYRYKEKLRMLAGLSIDLSQVTSSIVS